MVKVSRESVTHPIGAFPGPLDKSIHRRQCAGKGPMVGARTRPTPTPLKSFMTNHTTCFQFLRQFGWPGCAGTALWILWLVSATAGEVEERRIGEPVGWWERNGYAAMVPSIHLPTTHDTADLIYVWLYIPESGRIDAEYLPEQGRWSLVLPAGTRADRAEYYRVEGPRTDEASQFLDSPRTSESDWTLADVRGTRVLADGIQEFHVLRPISGEIHALLKGWAWRRGDRAAAAQATERLIELARVAGRPVDRGPMDEDGLASLRRLNDCADCHRPRMDRVTRREGDDDRAIERATDSMGFFVITAVLSDDSVVAHHRPEDLNHEDPFVQVRCGERPAELTHEDGYEQYVCPGDWVPMGHRDVRAALAAGHPYTQRMCKSRRWLAARMTDRARQAFRAAIAACAIEDDARTSDRFPENPY